MSSLTARVTLSALVVLAVFISLTGLALERAFRDSFLPAVGERLAAQRYLVMAETEVDTQGRLMVPARLPTVRLNLPGSGLYAWILDASGRVLWRSPSALGIESFPSVADTVAEQTRIDGELHFVSALDVEWEYDHRVLPLRFLVAEDQRAYLAELGRFRSTLWLWLGFMAALLLLVLGSLLAWGLRPLRQAAREVAAIESGAQSRLLGHYPRELDQLTANLNRLLQHEREQQSRYRNALSDLAHSLNTPLAVLRSHGERLDPKTLDEQIARMDDIVQYQLQRAGRAGRPALAAPVALAPLLHRLLAGLHKVYHDKDVRVVERLAGAVAFSGDPGDLMELLGNLLDNAFKWCRHEVVIEARQTDGRLILSIEDDGRGIDAQQKEEILQRGVRADEKVPGHGIGLAVARDIVAGYEGRLEIGASAAGGARIRVILGFGGQYT
ncbi:MAG TPA: HAMP domain-containing protein [Gammaproteobacteria bacterium]|nr:HAMP domain-containing protein [Gammaproteobacteria bacterium]